MFPGLATVSGGPVVGMGNFFLTVRHKERVIDLPSVQVVNVVIVLMIPGIDWVNKSGTFVYSWGGVGMVDYFPIDAQKFWASTFRNLPLF